MCLSPIHIHNKKSNLDLQHDKLDLIVPCGRCVECQVQRKYDYLLSTIAEVYNSAMSLFVTLTYSDFFVPHIRKVGTDINNPLCDEFDYTFSKRDLQLFLKRLRKLLWSKHKCRFRYIITCEYGTRGTFRPHYHCIFFFDKYIDSNLLYCCVNPHRRSLDRGYLVDCWQKGIVSTSSNNNGVLDNSFHACAYVCKYICKSFSNKWINSINDDIKKHSKRELVNNLYNKQKFGFCDIDEQCALRNRRDNMLRIPFVIKSMNYGECILSLPHFKVSKDLQVTYYDPVEQDICTKPLPRFLRNRLVAHRCRETDGDFTLDVKLLRNGNYKVVEVPHYTYFSVLDSRFQKNYYDVVEDAFNSRVIDNYKLINSCIDYVTKGNNNEDSFKFSDKDISSLFAVVNKVDDYTYYQFFNKGYFNYIHDDVKKSFAYRSASFVDVGVVRSWCDFDDDLLLFEVVEKVLYRFKRFAKKELYKKELDKFIINQKRKEYV